MSRINAVATIRYHQDRAALQAEFKRRIEMLERDFTKRLLATFQEFRARFDALRQELTKSA